MEENRKNDIKLSLRALRLRESIFILSDRAQNWMSPGPQIRIKPCLKHWQILEYMPDRGGILS